MESAVLDLESSFSCAMVYEALSRVRRIGGVHVTSFSTTKVSANACVAHFY